MTRKERFAFVIDYFRKKMPEVDTELDFKNTYQLLVAVILSAQCTDKRVNITTPALFRKYPNAKALANAKHKELLELIKSISYPNNKTKHLIGMAGMIQDKFNGIIPMNVDQLVLLPGVGRKTAHVITSVIDKQPNLAVDTHVFRVSKRIGLVPGTATTALAVEKHLIKHLQPEIIPNVHHWLILHGRYICVARKPKCEECGLRAACRYYQSLVKKNMFP